MNNNYQQNILIEKFREQAAKNAEKPAVKTGETMVSYAELQSRVMSIAAAVAGCYDDRFGLSSAEKVRYRRNILLWGIEGQERLKAAKVFVAGAGGSGSPLIIQLALCGVGTIVICDFDNVEMSNLNRQCLHDESRIGINKAISARMTVERLNPNVQVIAKTEKLTAENAYELIGGCAIIFDNVDDLETKFVLSGCSVHLGIPYVLSSMMELNSYAVILNPPQTPCLDCLYDRSKIEDYRTMRSLVKDYRIKPIAVAAPALFLSAGFACNEAIKILLGMENPAYNKYFLFNQRGTGDIVNTDGFKAIVYPFNNHFKEICRQQGFDWDVCWRGNFLEELSIRPDPRCPVCSDRNRVKELQAAARHKSGRPGPGRSLKPRYAALLFREYAWMLPAVLGSLQAGAGMVPLDPTAPEEVLCGMLDDAGARVILTDTADYSQAVKIRDMTNKHIAVINIGDCAVHIAGVDAGTGTKTEAGIEAHIEAQVNNTAYVIYAQNPDNTLTGTQYPVPSVLEALEKARADKYAGYTYQPGKVEVYNFHNAMIYLLGALLNGDMLAEESGIIVNASITDREENRQHLELDFEEEFDF